jgi:hypothetical protein
MRSLSARGQYRKETLIARFGGDVLMPDVRHLIAECPRKNAPGVACRVYYTVGRLRESRASGVRNEPSCRTL